jgi:hypothetical protein
MCENHDIETRPNSKADTATNSKLSSGVGNGGLYRIKNLNFMVSGVNDRNECIKFIGHSRLQNFDLDFNEVFSCNITNKHFNMDGIA